MRILLPPSEAKLVGGRDPAGPADGPLAEARAQVMDALIAFAADPKAATALALPERSAAEDLAANRAVGAAPRTPAIERYRGIVYAGLDVDTLTAAGRRRAEESVLIFSGLWGVLQAHEPVPAYRLPASATLPGLGPLTRFWRPVLAEVLPTLLGEDGPILDLRSSDYAGLWRPPPELADRVLAVRVLSLRPGLKPAVLSYPSKLGKGKLARALLSRRARVRGVGDVLDSWRAAGGSGGELGPGGALELFL